MTKKVKALVLSSVLVAGLAGCSSSSSSEAGKTDAASTEAGKETNSEYKVAMITDSGDITDQSFNQTTYESAKKFCEDKGLDFKYYKPEADSTEARDAKFDQAVADGYNVILLPGYMFGPTINTKADMYSDVKIIALDVTAGDISDEAGFAIQDNVATATYQEEISGYFAGYAAVKLGYNHLGFLGGMEVPAVQRFGYGYVQGANAAAVEMGKTSDVSMEYVYGGQFFGDKDITAYTDTWYKTKGVEVVFACGGGIFNSACESAVKEGINGKVIGVDSDQSFLINEKYADGLTVTSAMKRLDVTVNDMLSAILNGKWDDYKGKTTNYGIVSDDPEQNFVGIPMDTTQWSDSFTQDDYKALVAKVHSGEIKVSGDVTEKPVTEIAVDYQGQIK